MLYFKCGFLKTFAEILTECLSGCRSESILTESIKSKALIAGSNGRGLHTMKGYRY